MDLQSFFQVLFLQYKNLKKEENIVNIALRIMR